MTDIAMQKFLDAVKAGHTVLCADDLFDEIKDLPWAEGQLCLSKFMQPGTMVAIDVWQLEKAVSLW